MKSGLWIKHNFTSNHLGSRISFSSKDDNRNLLIFPSRYSKRASCLLLSKKQPINEPCVNAYVVKKIVKVRGPTTLPYMWHILLIDRFDNLRSIWRMGLVCKWHGLVRMIHQTVGQSLVRSAIISCEPHGSQVKLAPGWYGNHTAGSLRQTSSWASRFKANCILTHPEFRVYSVNAKNAQHTHNVTQVIASFKN